MLLTWLELRDFRCYETLSFSPDPGVNVLIGDNGAGKTSVLEGIGYLGLLRSLRGTPDEALVREGAETAIARGGFRKATGETTVEVEIPLTGRRRILLNTKRPQRNRDILTAVQVIGFEPDDLDLVKRGPALRRNYLDDLAAQLRPQAAADQAEFSKSLRQRNALLRQEGRNADALTLDAWDQRLAAAGARVVLTRHRVMDALDPFLGETYRLVGGEGNLVWVYGSRWTTDASADEVTLIDALTRKLSDRRFRDQEQRTTTAGPHRDDPGLILDGRDARTRASQGEQRTVALALRMGAHRLVTQQTDSTPVLLLDDVFSELDAGRVRGVLDLLDGGQVLVTSAREDEVPVPGMQWRVTSGELREL